MKKQTTYLKVHFDVCLYQYILFSFYNQNCYKNNILQSISDNHRGKLVNKERKNNYYKSNKITQ